MKAVKILMGQTVADIAVQELGDAARSMEIANGNGISLTEDLSGVDTLLVPAYDNSRRHIVALFADPANAPASSESSGDTEPEMEGIGYWNLENDFVVQ